MWKTIIIALFLTPGCAGYQVRPMPGAGAFDAFQKEAGGVVVAMCPLKDEKAVSTAFDANLRSRGILPVFVSIENRSDTEVSVRQDAASLWQEGYQLMRLAPDAVAEPLLFSPTIRYFAWSFLLFGVGIVPGLIDGVNAVEANRKIERDVADKTLHNQILAPGESTRGFLYFALAAGEEADRFRLALSRRQGEREVFTFELR